MINEDTPCTEENNQVYGFLCQKTNVFYAFESRETYQQFLSWPATQEETTDESNCITEERTEVPMIDEAQQLEDFEMATQEIMNVFEDPRFGHQNHDVELQEIDF
jgi:hypothetical protein